MKMKTSLYILALLLLISCGQKSSNKTTKTFESAVDIVADSSKVSEHNNELKKYIADGLFLKGTVRLFDTNQKRIGKLEISEIGPTFIIEKSKKMFNLDGDTDNCQKAFFLKVKYKNKEYIVFGQDVYEINQDQKFTTLNKKNEKITLFPITNFKMGAMDEDGLTDCEDYSILVLHNNSKNHYSLIKYPKSEFNWREPKLSQAVLFHDSSVEEKIYKIFMNKDTLIIGIKATYQEGGSVYNIKTILTKDFPESEITDTIKFETNENLQKKMDEIK
jgi:hypothetical protein